MKKLFPCLALIIVGCGTPKVWYQPGKTALDAQRDLAASKAEAIRISNPFAAFNGWAWLGQSIDRDEYVKQAMAARGYKPTPRDTVPDGPNYPKP
jgi:hypothetical protein